MWYENMPKQALTRLRTHKPKAEPANLTGVAVTRYAEGESGLTAAPPKEPMPVSSRQHVLLVTDGGALNNHQRGGWGYAICVAGKIVTQDYGRVWGTTNQRMEIQAVTEGMVKIFETWGFDVDVTIKSDSKYAIGILTKTRTGWLFKASVNHDVVEDGRTMIMSCKGNVKFEWVKGHSGDCPIHDMVDKTITKVYNQKKALPTVKAKNRRASKLQNKLARY